jgi:hypothetical protein
MNRPTFIETLIMKELFSHSLHFHVFLHDVFLAFVILILTLDISLLRHNVVRLIQTFSLII